MVEMAMGDDDRTDFGPFETEELELTCKFEAAPGMLGA
jgi:hypothetical protein